MRTRNTTASQISPQLHTDEIETKGNEKSVNPLDNLPPDPYRRETRALWRQQPHADNYTDSTFLSALVVNAELTRRSYWQVR